ncbi:MAG: methyltransferase domain-containing protein, partial [Gemmatimonadota bacterium]|nr:methyltransferase domain-containing protein [Gemmatimonadota bacterium]
MDERDPEKRGEKEHFFDRHAPGWDKETEEDNQDEVRALIEETGISAGDTVVEPGCGTGLISRLILEKAGKKGRLCGVDISNKMLDEARAKGLGPRASFLHSEASSMPFD